VPLVWVGVLGAATLLRRWSIRTLGASWNARAVVPSDLRPVAEGPYRLVRHPNYVAVALEFLALPLAGGAWLSALGLSALNALVLFDRIREEERLLATVPGYEQALGGKARFIPGIF
jgi:methyltransferase